jgi:hypothetical protein
MPCRGFGETLPRSEFRRTMVWVSDLGLFGLFAGRRASLTTPDQGRELKALVLFRYDTYADLVTKYCLLEVTEAVPCNVSTNYSGRSAKYESAKNDFSARRRF